MEELAATEPMLVRDEAASAYCADAPPSYGSDTLLTHYHRVIAQGDVVALGDHAMF